MNRYASATVLALLLVTSTQAQQRDTAATLHAQIDRIFRDRAYSVPQFGPARWLPDGSAYAVVENARGGGSEIARYDAATGARTVLVRLAQLVPRGTKEPLDIDDYAWSSDGQRLLIFTNTRRVWRQDTRGDYWVLDIASGSLKKLGGSAPESSLMFAKFSPDGTRVGYVRGNNIYVQDITSGTIAQLTHDGTALPDDVAWAPAAGGDMGTIVNGTSDWVNEEELDIRDGFRWSPDGRHIAYWQFDARHVGNFTLINDTASLYPTTRVYAYPKVGTTNSAVRIGIVAAAGGQTVWLDTPGDARNTYIASLEWVDPNHVAVQELNRIQTTDDYLLGDASTGRVTRLFHDAADEGSKPGGWVDAQTDVTWLDEGRAFLWVSERDGWRHVYRISRENGKAILLTRFSADVEDLVGVDEKAGTLYFLASPDNATQKYLYQSSLNGSGTPARVTPADEPGSHRYELAPGGRLAFHTYSTFDRVPAQDVVTLPAHQSLRSLTDPARVQARVSELEQRPVEFMRVAIDDGATLDGWMLKPADFDPSKKYPVIVFVYGEVGAQTVTDAWPGAQGLFHRALADAGYLVVSFDNRGTPAPKGAAWRKVVYHAIGVLSSAEQAAAIKALAAAHPFVDLDRVGIWGWSGGGSNTLNCLFRYPDVYKVGVAVAPVADQRLYDSIYEERYMGLPQENADGYRRGSPINFAEGLKGDLLLIHGSGDDNVHYQGTERLVNRLVELGKPFDELVYPNRTHALAEGAGTTVHVYHSIAGYFLMHLPAGPQ